LTTGRVLQILDSPVYYRYTTDMRDVRLIRHTMPSIAPLRYVRKVRTSCDFWPYTYFF